MSRFFSNQSGSDAFSSVFGSSGVHKIPKGVRMSNVDVAARTDWNMTRRVEAAMEFVQICHREMGLMRFPGRGEYEEAEFREQHLHPAAEGTYRSALGLLSRYFNGTLEGYMPGEQEEKKPEDGKYQG